MSFDVGIAGWAFNQAILRSKTMTLLEMPAACKRAGVQTIELVSSFFESQHPNYLNQVRQAIEAEDLHVRNIAVDLGNIANPDDATRGTDLEAIKQWFHLAKAVGSEAIRVNSGRAEVGDEEAIKRIIASYTELADEAAHTGVYLLIENHGGASADPKNIGRFIEAVGSPWFRTCPDTGNWGTAPWDEGMRITAPYAFSCHVKVYTYSEDGKQKMMMRDGREISYDLRESLRILRDAGYTGPLCMERGASATEEESAREAVDYLREVVATL